MSRAKNATIVEDAQRLLDLQDQAADLNREIEEIKLRIRAAKGGAPACGSPDAKPDA